MSDIEQIDDMPNDEPPLKKARKLVKKNVDTIDEEEVLDLNGQSNQNGNMDDENEIEDDEDDQDEDENEFYHQYRFMGRANQQGFNVSAHDLREAQEIFGEGLDELDEDIDETVEVRDSSTTSGLSFEYFQQVQSFSLAFDEDIRNSDIPERFHFIFEGIKDLPVNYEIEAVWIVRKLRDNAKLHNLEFSDAKTQELMDAIPHILAFIHEDGLEVPTIWLYKRDYLPERLSRNQLWDIFWLDVNFRKFEREKISAISMLSKIEESVEDIIDAEDRHAVEELIMYLRQCIEFPLNDDIAEFAISSIPLLVQRLQRFEDAQGVVKKKTTYGKFSHLKAVRAVVDALIVPAHQVGKSLKNDVEISPPSIPSRTFQDFVSSILITHSHSSTDTEITRLISIAFNVAAKEISCDPLVRNFAKKFYLEEGSLNTNITDRGLSEISPFNEYFGLQLLRRKPLREFLSSDGLILFMRLLEAEEKGLITIEFLNPFKDIQQSSHKQSSIASFSDKIFKILVQQSPSDEGISEEARSSFDEARLLLFEKIMGDNISHLVVKDVKSELLKLGRLLIISQACDAFEKKLKTGPFATGQQNVSKNLRVSRLLLECPNRPRCQKVVGMYISPDFGSIDAVCVDREAALLSTCFMPSLMTTDWEEKLKLFLFEHKPDAIVLNSSGREKTNRVKSRIETKIIHDVNDAITVLPIANESDDEEIQVVSYSVEVVIFDDELPGLFMRSQRAKTMYPELESKTCAALCLARLAIEPLLEFCSLWKGVDSMSTFGFEAMYLKLHPLQDMIKHEKRLFLQLLEMKLVQTVSDVGVDLHHATRHKHYGIMLAFLPGLGLRKADKLIGNIIRAPDKISSRFSLHNNELFLTSSIWANACGFIRLSQKLGYQRFNFLDNTRIHPICYEVYDFVRRICADALDVENKPESQMKIIADMRTNIRQVVESYFFPDKVTGNVKWERVLESVDFGTSIVADGGFSRKYKEIKDALEVLELTEYADELEASGKGRRRFELDLIKDELRFPWLDLRRFNSGYSSEEFRNFLKQETLGSIYLGQKMAVRIIEIRNGRSPLVLVETDEGIRGFVNDSEISDEQKEFKYEELCAKMSIGERRIGVVVGLRYGDKLVLSLRPSVCSRSEAWWMRNRTDANIEAKEWWSFYCAGRGKPSDLRSIFDEHFYEDVALTKFENMEKEAKSSLAEQAVNSMKSKTLIENGVAMSEKIDQSVRFHPFFVNLSAAQAEDFLRRRMAENRISIPAVIRPSSRGPTHLAIVWAFRPDEFMHIHVEQVPNQREPGRVLFVVDHPSSSRPFADIDEIFSEYIGRMHDYVVSMTKHKNFHPGRVAEVENDMRRQITENPERIAYYLRYEDDKPGMFAITWMDKSMACRTVRIMVTNTGFQAGSRSFASPSEIVAWLKRSAAQHQEPQSAHTQPRRQSRFA